MTKDLHPGLGSGALREALERRITDYLTGGGVFNAEMALHDRVRDLLIDCRDALSLSSPIEPPQHDHDHFDSQPCPICRDRSVAQASSEIREAGVGYSEDSAFSVNHAAIRKMKRERGETK